MEHIYHIKYEYHENGKSIREIARETGHDRATVKKYLSMENFNLETPIKQRRKGKTDLYRDQVKAWLLEDESAPRKQRHTAHRVFIRLQEEVKKAGGSLDLSERAIRYLVAELREELGQQESVSLPLFHPAGECQVDFGETGFYERGIYYTGFHLALTFPHSDAKFTQLFKGQNFECLVEGLASIFTFIGGVPSAIWFDNLSPVVKAIKVWGEREVTENFRRLQCHFGFRSNFCNPASGHEKGSVENYVGTSRRNYFVPVPCLDDIKRYNRELLEKCQADLDRVHYKYDRRVQDLFQEDLKVLKNLPRANFEACTYTIARTDKYGMCKFQANRYSTAGHLRTCEVTLKVGAHTVTILDRQSKPIVVHPRLYGSKKESMIWSPYLNVLAKRPTALCYSGFFQKLPSPLKEFLGQQELADKKKILQVLAKNSQDDSLEYTLAALSQAMQMKPKSADDLICGFDYLMNKPGPLPKNSVPEGLPQTPEFRIDLDVYAQLVEGQLCNRK